MISSFFKIVVKVIALFVFGVTILISLIFGLRLWGIYKTGGPEHEYRRVAAEEIEILFWSIQDYREKNNGEYPPELGAVAEFYKARSKSSKISVHDFAQAKQEHYYLRPKQPLDNHEAVLVGKPQTGQRGSFVFKVGGGLAFTLTNEVEKLVAH